MIKMYNGQFTGFQHPQQQQQQQLMQQQFHQAYNQMPIQQPQQLYPSNGEVPTQKQEPFQPEERQNQHSTDPSNLLLLPQNQLNGYIPPYEQQQLQPTNSQLTLHKHESHLGQHIPSTQQQQIFPSNNSFLPIPQQSYHPNGQIPFNQQQLQEQQYLQQQQSVFAQLDRYLTNDRLNPLPQKYKPPAQKYSKFQQQSIQPYPSSLSQQQQPYFQPQMLPPTMMPYPMLPTIPPITEELSKNLDPEYAKELDILYVLLRNATSKDEIISIFFGFSQKFLVLPFLWSYRLQLLNQSFMYPTTEQIQIIKKSLYDFYYNDQLPINQLQQSLKCFDRTFLSNGRSNWANFGQQQPPSNYFITKGKEDLFFPNEYMVNAFRFYEAYSDQILSQKDYLKYKKALQHSQRIIAADSLRKLFCCFTEYEEDPKFVIQNVEMLIAQNPTCQWLWKSYLQYLRERQPKVYLDVFQKYIRFFISDKAMAQYFEVEKQRITNSTTNLSNFQSLESFLMDDAKQNIYLKPQHAYRIHNSSNFKNAYEQKFSLPPNLIQYLLSKASPRQLQTLFETCKQIFLLPMSPICCNLTVTAYDEANFRSPCFQQSFKFSSFIPWELQNIFLVKSLIIESSKPATILSAIISKISRCEIWCLNVHGQSVLWDELKILLESGNIEKFVFIGGYISIGYGMTMVPIEDVIEMLPKAHTVILDSAAFTPQTFTKLSTINRLSKFKEFTIERVTPCFRIFDFEYFITKHASPISNFKFIFDSGTPNTFIKKFNNFIISKLFKDWPSTVSKPLISISKNKR